MMHEIRDEISPDMTLPCQDMTWNHTTTRNHRKTRPARHLPQIPMTALASMRAHSRSRAKTLREHGPTLRPYLETRALRNVLGKNDVFFFLERYDMFCFIDETMQGGCAGAQACECVRGEDIFVNFTDPLTLLRARTSFRNWYLSTKNFVRWT